MSVKLLLLRHLFCVIFFLGVKFCSAAEAQQMFVDDAAVTTERSFQVETWHGSRESWFLTAISPVRGLEIGTGIGVDLRDGFDSSNWIIEAKFVPGDLEDYGSAIGLVAGALYNFEGDFEEYFAY